MTILPLYNIIALPGAKLWMQANVFRELTGKEPVAGERVSLLMQKEETPSAAPGADSFHPIGTSGVLSEVNESGFVAIDIRSRINIEEVTLLRERTFSMSVSRRADVEDLDPEEAQRRLTEVKERILTFAKGKPWESVLRSFAAYWDTLWTVGAAMSPWLRVSAEDRYAVLAEDSLHARFDLLERILLEGLELADVQSAAQSAQQEDH